MPTINVKDRRSVLGVGTTYNLSFPRALTLLAQATSPSPRSRYRPSSRWTIAKYATVCDPRRIRGSAGPFIVNPGIRDLDPHQKGVLADDIGMALALGLLDQTHGIVGIADVYALHAAGSLSLRTKGRHRNMPDFVIELRRPISRSRIVLLECKGSTSPGQYSSQLNTACGKQLANVRTVYGSNAGGVPKIAAATELVLGGQVSVYVDDPPEPLEPLGEKLRANLLALEYSLFGDLRSANEVWKAYDLPTFTGTPSSSQLPEGAASSAHDEAVAELIRPQRLKPSAIGEFEEKASGGIAYASTRVQITMSPSAQDARPNQSWASVVAARDTLMPFESTPLTSDSISPTVADEDNGSRRRIEETAATTTGIRASVTTQVWFD
jgi:hypothetical protein